MSQQNPVLYGSRLYGDVLYALTEDYETYNTAFYESASVSDIQAVQTITKAINDILASADLKTTVGIKSLLDTETLTDSLLKALTTHFADSLTSSDIRTFEATKVITDALLALDETIEVMSTKVLSDSASLADQIALTIQKVLLDVLATLDSRLLITATKDLTDFIEFREWISITLKKVNPWQSGLASQSAVPLPLYGRILYGSSLYGYTPYGTWGKPSVSRSSFTNRDGESH